MEMKVKMEFEKETKGTVRYAEVIDPDGMTVVIGTLYIKKSVLTTPYPKEVEVRISS